MSNGGIASAYIVFACVDRSMGIKGSGAFVVPGDAKLLKIIDGANEILMTKAAKLL